MMEKIYYIIYYIILLNYYNSINNTYIDIIDK